METRERRRTKPRVDVSFTNKVVFSEVAAERELADKGRRPVLFDEFDSVAGGTGSALWLVCAIESPSLGHTDTPSEVAGIEDAIFPIVPTE